MTRRIFTSFHYEPDHWRAAQIRNIGKIEGNIMATPNKWEEVIKTGDKRIKEWIDENMKEKTCVVVFVGNKTASRKWVKYEIQKAWDDGKGVFGIYVHNLKDQAGEQTVKGRNPFENFYVGNEKLSSIIKCYDPPFAISKRVYDYIKANIENWIEEAIKIRSNY